MKIMWTTENGKENGRRQVGVDKETGTKSEQTINAIRAH